MNDILIKIDTKTAKAYCENNRIGVQHANLQNKLIFEMSEKINGSAWLEYEINGTKNYAEMEDTENGYQIDIKSCLLVSNNVNVDLKITESEDVEGIPIFISTIVELDVYDSINATTEEPEYYPDWKTVADSKIAEMNQLKEDVNEAITKTNNLNIDVSKSGKVATVTLTKKDATTKFITLSDGTNLMFNWDGTRLGIKTDEEQEYTYVDLIGPQGIQGETGVTPNLTIGTVITGNTSSATITGTSENPVLNLVLEKGDTGETGATGNGIASITKTGTSGNIDTYTITYTNGTTSTFTVTNSTVTNQEFEELKAEHEELVNTLPRVEGTGESITLDNTAQYNMNVALNPSELSQTQYTGRNKANFETIDYRTDNGATVLRTGQEYSVTSGSSRWASCRFEQENLNLKPNTTYTFSALVKSTTSSSGSFVFVYAAGSNTGNTIQGTASSAGNRSYVTFTTPSEISDVSLISLIVNVSNGSAVFTDVMIEESATMGDYEPYVGGVPSPNPLYPQPIKKVTGNNSITVCGKNLFSSDNKLRSIVVGCTPTEATVNSFILNGTTSWSNRSLTIGNSFKNQDMYIKATFKSSLARKIAITVYGTNELLYTSSDLNSIGSVNYGLISNQEVTIGKSFNTSNYDYLVLRFWNNDTGTTLGSAVDLYISDICLNIGSEIAYEPYQGQTFTINLGANLFDKDSAIYDNSHYKNDSGTVSSSSSSGYTTSYVGVQPNTTYIIDGVGINRMYYYDSSKNWISRSSSGISLPHIFTTPNNCYYIQFQYTMSVYDANKVIIEEGTTTSYKPYGTSAIEYCKIGNYSDEFYLDNGNWYLKKNIGKVILDGTETWSSRTNNVGVKEYYCTTTASDINSDTYISQMCNYGTYSRNAYNSGTVGKFAILTNNYKFYLCVPDEFTLETFKTNIGVTNITLYYVTKATTGEAITDTTLIEQLNNLYNQIKSCKGQTNITQTNAELPFNIDASALYDLNNLISRVATLEVEV